MAKIYESAERRVNLQGRRAGKGFSPRQAVDRTSAVRQQQADFTRQLERASTFGVQSAKDAAGMFVENYRKTSSMSQESFENAGRNQLRNNQVLNDVQNRQLMRSMELNNEMGNRAQASAIDQAKQNENQYLSQLSGVLQTNLESRQAAAQSLVKFSETLGNFVVEQVKAKNEQSYKIGLMRGMNGEVVPPPDQVQKFRQGVAVLENAAVAEGQLNESLSQVDRPAAEQDRVTSPIRNAWERYGMAEGQAKRAAAQYQIAMDAFMDSGDATVPLPDGRMISPREARLLGPAAINAALAVGQQMFIEASGLAHINPMLIFEHVTPTVQSVNNALMSNMLAQGRREYKEERLAEADASIGVGWRTLDADNAAAVQEFFQSGVNKYRVEGIGRGEANKRFLDQAFALAGATENIELLAALENTLINPDNPGMGTLGDRYPEEFKKTYIEVAAAIQAAERENEQAQNEMVDRIQIDYRSALAGAGTNKEAMSQAWNGAKQALSQLASTGNIKALEALQELEMQGAYRNPFAYSQIVGEIQSGREPPSEDQLQQLVLEKTLTSEEANKIRALKPDDRALQNAKAQEGTVKRQVRAALIRNFKMTTIDADERNEMLAHLEDTMVGEIMPDLRSQFNNYYAQGKEPSPAEVNALTQRLVEQLSSDPRYQGSYDPATQRIKTNAPLAQSGFVTSTVNPNTGARQRDFVRVDPYVIQQQRPPLSSSLVLSPEELTKNAQAFVNGQEPTQRARQVMQASGQSFENLLRAQHQAYGLPFTDISQSQFAQSAAERRRLAPGAAAIIDNPNIPAWRKTRAFREVNVARAAAERRAAEAQAARSVPEGPESLAGKVQAFRPLMDLVGNAEGGAQQYNAINRGRADDTPNGYPGLTNLTIAEVMRLQQQGYNAAGRYQFIRSTLQETVRDAGLDPNTTKFTPEVQDQLFVARLTLSPVRARLGAYLRGESEDINAAITDLSNEFAVVKNFTGRSGIEGIAGNRSSIEPTQIAHMLRQARQANQRSASAASGSITSPSLNKLASGQLYTPERSGLCVTTVLETLALHGLDPNRLTTGGDPNNNPRGLAAQLANTYGWKPLPGVGKARTINSPAYGSFQANVMTLAEYERAANAGRVPSGAVVFQTMRDWDGNASGSRGFDAAIARNGGRNLWNGTVQNGRGVMLGSSVYGPNTTQVFVMIPRDAIVP